MVTLAKTNIKQNELGVLHQLLRAHRLQADEQLYSGFETSSGRSRSRRGQRNESTQSSPGQSLYPFAINHLLLLIFVIPCYIF